MFVVFSRLAGAKRTFTQTHTNQRTLLAHVASSQGKHLAGSMRHEPTGCVISVVMCLRTMKGSGIGSLPRPPHVFVEA